MVKALGKRMEKAEGALRPAKFKELEDLLREIELDKRKDLTDAEKTLMDQLKQTPVSPRLERALREI